MKFTRVLITVEVFSGDRYDTTSPYDEPVGEVVALVVPSENYGNLLEELVERAHDGYVDAVQNDD